LFYATCRRAPAGDIFFVIVFIFAPPWRIADYFYFFFKVTIPLVYAHFFPFLSRKKNKEIGERKKKKDRGQASACRQIWEYSA